jgi:predicted SprT family Zn-dependent metalloprotease
MVAAPNAHQHRLPVPPPRQTGPIVHGGHTIQNWLIYYWQKLQLPLHELNLLAITQDRQEFMRWTGKRLNVMALGCYCYLPASLVHHASPSTRTQKSARLSPSASTALPGWEERDSRPQHEPAHRHIIFIEPDMQPQSLEVTVAHELIHLADRVHGTPRRHHHHGYDSIAADEAAITGYDVEELRHLLHDESLHREGIRRARRPIRYLYECPNCGKQYPRTRRYSQAVSCSHCDKTYNPHYKLSLHT